MVKGERSSLPIMTVFCVHYRKEPVRAMKRYFTLFILSGCFIAASAQAPREKEEFEWVSLGKKVNSIYHDSAPVISPDGKTLYFTITNHPENNYGTDKSQDIWCTMLDSTGQWSDAVHMAAPFNKNRYNQVLSISKDGNRLLIRGGNGKEDLGFSICKRENGKWQKPEALSIPDFEEMCQGVFNGAFLSYDERALILYFSERPKSKYSDLYACFLQDNGKWTRPQLITCLNTHMDEFGPYLAPDNHTLYFASNRSGGFGSTDVYKTQRLDDTWLKWSEPENVGAPVNTGGFDAYYAVADVDTLVFTTRAFMTPDGGHLDIFSLKRIIKEPVEAPKLFLSGYVYNIKTSDPVKANIRFERDGETLEIGHSDAEYGEYQTELPDGGKYILEVSAEGFFATTDSIEIEMLAGEGKDKEVYKDIFLKPMEVGLSVRLNNIFFDLDKTILKPESFPELDRVVELMDQNPNLKIEIGGHTDSQGSEEYNQKLSQGRAEAVMNYLLEQAIDTERVTAVGYGENKPEVPNDTEKNRQINRRVAFTILNK